MLGRFTLRDQGILLIIILTCSYNGCDWKDHPVDSRLRCVADAKSWIDSMRNVFIIDVSSCD